MDKLQDLLKLLHDSLTREEFIASFKLVIDAVQKAKSELSAQINTKTQDALAELDKLNTIYQETIQKIQDDNTSSLSNIKKWALEKVGALYVNSGLEKKIDNRLNEVQSIVERKIAQVKELDTSTIALEASKLASNELLSLIPSKIALEEEIPKFGENIVDAINLLPTDNDQDKIAIEHIRGLRDELDRILKTAESKVVMGGGSVGKQNMYYYDLTPYLDGVTSTFSLPAFARILKVETFSAAVLRPSIDWTADSSNHTLTFTSEIDPAVYLRAGQTTLVYYAI